MIILLCIAVILLRMYTRIYTDCDDINDKSYITYASYYCNVVRNYWTYRDQLEIILLFAIRYHNII